MDKQLAALNPQAADRFAVDKVAEAITTEPKPEPEPDPLGRSRSRVAFVGLADEIRNQSLSESLKRDADARKLWGE